MDCEYVLTYFNMTIRIILVALCFVIHLKSAAGSRDYLNGYIVYMGDTVRGKIKPSSKCFKVYTSRDRKTRKYKGSQVTAYRHGRQSFEFVDRWWRIVVDGPVRLYLVEFSTHTYQYSGQGIEARYYAVKRPSEKKMTILYARQYNSGIWLDLDNPWAEIAIYLGSQLVTHAIVDKAMTDEVSFKNNYRDIAYYYFSDCPGILRDLDAGKYKKLGSLYSMVRRYNAFKIHGEEAEFN